jgi:hypothetical protein
MGHFSEASLETEEGVSSWISWSLKMEPTGCPETSVRNYHYTLRNIPEERRSEKLSCLLKISLRFITESSGSLAARPSRDHPQYGLQFPKFISKIFSSFCASQAWAFSAKIFYFLFMFFLHGTYKPVSQKQVC